tara:strand:+ start:10653 stop:11555 length:903 start_codon:yes stop_codon:yes gene_type:complete
MIKFTQILEEKSPQSPLSDLDSKVNRRLLSIISKQLPKKIEIAYDAFNGNSRYKTFIKSYILPIQKFIRDVLYISEPTRIGQLIWILLLNGKKNYLVDDITTNWDGYLYHISAYGDIQEEWDTRYEECYECDGYGSNDEECQMCDGSGEEETDTDDEGNPIMISCDSCEGSGEVTNDCEECGGGGEVPEDYEEYTINLYEWIMLSLEDIPTPSTIISPTRKAKFDDGSTHIMVPPVNYNDFMDKYSDDVIILDEIFMDDVTEEYVSYVEDDANKIEEFQKKKVSEPGVMDMIIIDILGKV